MKSIQVILRHSLVDEGTSRWIAQGLELDIATDGENPEEALVRFADALACEWAFATAQNIKLEDRVPAAPEKLRDLLHQKGKLPTMDVEAPPMLPQGCPPIKMNPCLAA